MLDLRQPVEQEREAVLMQVGVYLYQLHKLLGEGKWPLHNRNWPVAASEVRDEDRDQSGSRSELLVLEEVEEASVRTAVRKLLAGLGCERVQVQELVLTTRMSCCCVSVSVISV